MRSPSARTLRLLAIAAVLAASVGRASAQPVDPGSVTIVRDRFGVPHVYGPTDASVVFGLAYAQAEDNLELLEYSALLALGRATELEGEGEREQAFWSALLVRAFELPRLSREEYQRAAPAMRALYDAYAAGLNHYLARHPGARLRVLERFEPWHTLAMLREKYYLQEFIWYTGLRPQELRVSGLRWREDDSSGAAWRRSAFPPPAAFAAAERAAGREPAQGSNMWAVAPSRSASGNALLFMNPHIGFFGPYQYYESHLASGEGLHFSGTGRYGFPLPYIGHNERLGWSHTDNDPDHGDLYLERFEHPSDPLAYRYGDGWRQAVQWTDTIRVRTAAGVEARPVTLLRTHHGPVVAERNGRRVAVRLAKLEEGGWYDQWYAMARAQSLEEFRA
ncbi:MAG TPA: penicillin acylase family protein, partial [Longimicrobiaceae bacterium]|nr:penicillin acylase family protein [Longimicrobiaceae bacterium]